MIKFSCIDFLQIKFMNFGMLISKLCISFFILFFSTVSVASNCIPQTQSSTKIVPGLVFYTIEGDLAEFDPCHSSVSININKAKPTAPIFILIHGGHGLTNDVRNLSAALINLGFSTIYFDAFQMNDLYPRGMSWFQMSNDPKQRMLYKSNLAAYHWIAENYPNAEDVYLYGISNGATTAVNIAAIEGLNKIKGVLAEGMPTLGLGLPNEIFYPVRLIYGKLDSYAAKSLDVKLWNRRNTCIMNTEIFSQPLGNAVNCNPGWGVYMTDFTEEPIKWFDRLKSLNFDLEIWWLEETAHSLFVGNLIKNTYNDVDGRRYAWIGGSNNDRSKLLSLLSNFSSYAN